MKDPIILLERELAPTDAESWELFQRLGEILSGSAARDRSFAIELVAREAVQNAIEYGSGRDPAKRLRFKASIAGDAFRMEVEDEGPGFDADAVLAAENSGEPGTSGNGLRIISVYSDRYHYEHGGRRLVAEFVLGEARTMQGVKEPGTWAPQSDIVAANAQAAKDELRALVASSAGEFVVDLSTVRMIDSRGLGILIAAVNSLEAAGRTMRVIGANEDLLGLLRMMRMDRHMKLG